jgi:hypothetical protein
MKATDDLEKCKYGFLKITGKITNGKDAIINITRMI